MDLQNNPVEPTGSRLIDADPRTRTKPMRLLVLGMCRTGTSSLATALRRLGYTPHHMRTVLTNPRDIPLWQEAAELTLLPTNAKPVSQHNVAPYGRAEFDKLLGNCDVVMDLPGVAFAQQLLDAYPDAQVILTHRRYDDWEKSMQGSIWCLFTWRLFVLCRIFYIGKMAPLMNLLHTLFYAHNDNHYGGEEARKAYERHYREIKERVPGERLLEMGPGRFEWRPLLRFLGKDGEVKGEEDLGVFPQVDDEGSQMYNQLLATWWGLVRYLILLMLIPGSAAVAGIVLWFWKEQVWGVVDGLVLGPLREFMDAGRAGGRDEVGAVSSDSTGMGGANVTGKDEL